MEQEAQAATQQDKGGEGVRAVERALDVLAAFSPGDGELLVADLVKRVGLSRPTLYRLLHTLEKKGYVASSGEPQRFRLEAQPAYVETLLTFTRLPAPDQAEPVALPGGEVLLASVPAEVDGGLLAPDSAAWIRS